MTQLVRPNILDQQKEKHDFDASCPNKPWTRYTLLHKQKTHTHSFIYLHDFDTTKQLSKRMVISDQVSPGMQVSCMNSE